MHTLILCMILEFVLLSFFTLFSFVYLILEGRKCGNFPLFPVCGLLCFLLYCHVLKYCVSLSIIKSFLCLESYDTNF